MIIIIRLLLLTLSLITTNVWAKVAVVRYPSGTPVQVCQASDALCSGGIAGNIQTVTTNYSILSTDGFIRASGNITLTLPASLGQGKAYNIINIGTGTVTVQSAGTDTIDSIGSFMTISPKSPYVDIYIIDAAAGHWEVLSI